MFLLPFSSTKWPRINEYINKEGCREGLTDQGIGIKWIKFERKERRMSEQIDRRIEERGRMWRIGLSAGEGVLVSAS